MKTNGFEIPEEVVRILLRDYTTNESIVWGTASYGYDENSHIDANDIMSGKVRLKPVYREFGKDSLIPIEQVKKDNDEMFDVTGKSSEEIICMKSFERHCNDAPHTVSLYDESTGDIVMLPFREGLLDRKMALINSLPLTHDETNWKVCTSNALMSSYGYEYRGDHLYMARRNILCDVIDWYEDKFGKDIGVDMMKEFADIISRNFVQMNESRGCIPFTDIKTRIMKWSTGEMIELCRS